MKNISEFNNHQYLIESLSFYKREFREYSEKINNVERESYSDVKNFLELLKSNSWSIPLNFEPMTLVQMRSYSKMSAYKLNEMFLEFFKKDDYRELIDVINIIIKEVPKEFKNQVIRMKKIIEQDISDYVVIVPALFALLDNIVSTKFELKNYTKKAEIAKILDKKYRINTNKKINILIDISILEQVEKYFKPTGSKKSFNRHCILHGTFTPDKYYIDDFIKLINLIDGVLAL